MGPPALFVPSDKMIYKQLLVTLYVLSLAFGLSSVFVSFTPTGILLSFLIHGSGWHEVHVFRHYAYAKSLTKEVLLHRDWTQFLVSIGHMYPLNETLINFSACWLFTFQLLSWPSWPSLWYSMAFKKIYFYTRLDRWIKPLIINILYKKNTNSYNVRWKQHASQRILGGVRLAGKDFSNLYGVIDKGKLVST